MRTKQALLEYIPVNSRLGAVRLKGTVRIRKNKDMPLCSFVVYVYGLADCSSDEIKDEFYRKLSDLFQKSKLSVVVIVAGDFIAQVDKLK